MQQHDSTGACREAGTAGMDSRRPAGCNSLNHFCVNDQVDDILFGTAVTCHLSGTVLAQHRCCHQPLLLF